LSPGLTALFSWLEEDGHAVDLEALHARHPEVGWHSFADWAGEQDWSALTSARSMLGCAG
jgi:hypothetical protein